MVALLTISSAKVLAVVGLPVYSLPFNVIVLAFLYVLQFRANTTKTLQTYFVQYNAPEKNFYAFSNYVRRFGRERKVAIHLPFHGEWEVTQAYDGPYTHKGDWKYAWDFEIRDEAGKTYRNDGDYAEDYYCFGKVVLAPADGTVETVLDGIEDNIIGQKNLEHNWGNTIVLQHGAGLYSKLSHLKQGSITVKPGDKIRKGDPVAQCGNSGNSPYPHLHFQLQATPYIGSKTLRYPLSHLYLQRGGKRQMLEQAEPQTGDRVMNVQPHPSLRAAFYLVNGQQFCWKDATHPEQLIRWEVAIDTYLNKYILCKATSSRAYFKVLDTMLYFTHFEGSRQSLLYRFYLAAHKISFGFERGMQLTDHIALNRVYTARQLWLHDFVAPFFQYLDAVYTVLYPNVQNERLIRDITLSGTVTTKRMGKTSTGQQFTLQVDAEGLKAFTFLSPHHKTEAVCVKDPATC